MQRGPENIGGSRASAPRESSEALSQNASAAAASRAILADTLPAGEQVDDLRRASVLNAAERWSEQMQATVIPNLLHGAQNLQTTLPAVFGGLPAAEQGLKTMLDALVDACNACMQSTPANAYPVFFLVEQLGRKLAMISPMPEQLLPLVELIEDAYQGLNMGRPPMRREGSRNRDVDERAGTVLRLTFTVIAMGGFLTQGLLYYFSKDAEGKRTMNMNAILLYGGLLGLGAFGDRLSSMMRAPGSDGLIRSLAEVRFMGEPGAFRTLTSTYGLHGPDVAGLAQAIYDDADLQAAAQKNSPFTEAQQQRILDLAPTPDLRERYRRMLTAATPGKPAGQPMRDFIGALGNARSPEAQRVVLAYFQSDAGPHQMQALTQAATDA